MTLSCPTFKCGIFFLVLALSFCHFSLPAFGQEGQTGKEVVLKRIKAEKGDASKYTFLIFMMRITVDKDKTEDKIHAAEQKDFEAAEEHFKEAKEKDPSLTGFLFKSTVLDKSLRYKNKVWFGKKEGATHILKGNVVLFDYEFNSNKDNPLTFKITKNGYVYVKGSGTVKDLKANKTYTFN
jgi:hypothetical protein